MLAIMRRDRDHQTYAVNVGECPAWQALERAMDVLCTFGEPGPTWRLLCTYTPAEGETVPDRKVWTLS